MVGTGGDDDRTAAIRIGFSHQFLDVTGKVGFDDRIEGARYAKVLRLLSHAHGKRHAALPFQHLAGIVFKICRERNLTASWPFSMSRTDWLLRPA